MEKDNYYLTISKTANKIGVQPHVLRFWEKNFLIINPKKKVLVEEGIILLLT